MLGARCPERLLLYVVAGAQPGSQQRGVIEASQPVDGHAPVVDGRGDRLLDLQRPLLEAEGGGRVGAAQADPAEANGFDTLIPAPHTPRVLTAYAVGRGPQSGRLQP